jgi:hypothetical protein
MARDLIDVAVPRLGTGSPGPVATRKIAPANVASRFVQGAFAKVVGKRLTD